MMWNDTIKTYRCIKPPANKLQSPIVETTGASTTVETMDLISRGWTHFCFSFWKYALEHTDVLYSHQCVLNIEDNRSQIFVGD